MDSPDASAHPSNGGAPLVEGTDTVATFRRRLLAFFDAHARDLPWRGTDDPYAVWVSEIMLQQTRVETVVPYFERWMERFPTVEALASAGQDEVLKLWEGLGYYRRARMLHEAAGRVRDRRDGILPDDPDGLRNLPGIGPYTAGAIASIAFGRAVPAVDGNVRRVLARLYDLADPSDGDLRSRARKLVDPDRPGDFNQGLMELGATVCTPRGPSCEACPVSDLCAARAAGTEEMRPAPTRRAPIPERTYDVSVVVRDGDGPGSPEVLVRKRPPEGLLGGMWELPCERVDDDTEPRRSEDVGAPLPTVTHVYSHFRGRYRPVLLRDRDAARDEGPSGAAEHEGAEVRWIPVTGEPGRDTPLPVAMQTILAHLRHHLAGPRDSRSRSTVDPRPGEDR